MVLPPLVLLAGLLNGAVAFPPRDSDPQKPFLGAKKYTVVNPDGKYV
jgi:hypothetical protein